MTKRDIQGEILAGLRNAVAYAKGDTAGSRTHIVNVPADVDVRAIRRRTGLSQDRFAERYGFAASAVRDWEQGRRRPERAARVLLKVIDAEPEAVERALSA